MDVRRIFLKELHQREREQHQGTKSFKNSVECMNSKNKQLWIDALLSEDYVEGESRYLCVGNAFSFGGVLCDIAVKHGILKPAKPALVGENLLWVNKIMSFGIESNTSAPPQEVRRWMMINVQHVFCVGNVPIQFIFNLSFKQFAQLLIEDKVKTQHAETLF